MRRYSSLTFSLSCGSFYCTFSSRRCPCLFSFKLNSLIFFFFFLFNWQVVHYRLLVEPLIWNESLQQYIIQLIDFSNLPILCSKYFHEHPKPYKKTHQSQQLSLPNLNTFKQILVSTSHICIVEGEIDASECIRLIQARNKGFWCGNKPIQARNKGCTWQNSNKSPIKILHNT